MTALAETLKHPEFPRLALRAFLIAALALGALVLGTFFWLDSRSDSAMDSLRARMPSARVAIEGAVAETPPPAALLPSVPAAAAPAAPAAAASPAPATPAHESAPFEGLFETAGDGVLPMIRAADGLTPFAAYRRPAPATDGHARVAIALLDVGLSAEAAQAALKALPPEASLIFSPYGENLNALQDQARGAGHEIWLALPLESSAVPSPDPGAQAIYLNASMERNRERLLWTLARAPGYAGVAAITPSPVMKSAAQTPRLLSAVFERGLGFADLADRPAEPAMLEAIKANAPYVGGGFPIDADPDPEAIRARLDQAAEKARKDGSLVLVLRPYPASLEAIRRWSAERKDKEIALVPLSALTDAP